MLRSIPQSLAAVRSRDLRIARDVGGKLSGSLQQIGRSRRALLRAPIELLRTEVGVDFFRAERADGRRKLDVCGRMVLDRLCGFASAALHEKRTHQQGRRAQHARAPSSGRSTHRSAHSVRSAWIGSRREARRAG
jgi:hypothetical protein